MPFHTGLDASPSPASIEPFWPAPPGGLIERGMRETASEETLLETADWAEARPLIEAARGGLALADEGAIRRMLGKNPDLIQAIREHAGGPAVGLFAYLPLTPFGAASILSGRFDGADPDPAWIARAGERPQAIYHWLVYAPGLYKRSFAAIGRLHRRVAPGGCPIHTRGVTPDSRMLHIAMGFAPAAEIFGGAPDWLLTMAPERVADARAPAKGRIDIRLVRDFDGMEKIFAIRSSTYLAEQFCLHDEEFDGNDFCATQMLGLIDGDPAGCIRLRYFGDFAKVERLAVRREYRHSRLAFRLVREALVHLRRKGFTRAYGHARIDLVPFWRMFGFRELGERRPFDFAQIRYAEMAADLAPDPAAIRFGVAPMISIRPEGAWDEPGPLDLSNLRDDATREALLRAHTRTVG